MIIIKVLRHCKKGNTDHNGVKFELNIIEEEGKVMTEEKLVVNSYSNRCHCKHHNLKVFDCK